MLKEVKALVQGFQAGPLDGHINVIKDTFYIHFAGLNAKSGEGLVFLCMLSFLEQIPFADHM